MKVLAINGSSRKNGNTAIILNTVREELDKEELNYEQLMKHGLKTTQSMSRMAEELIEYIEEICNLDDIQYYDEKEFFSE